MSSWWKTLLVMIAVVPMTMYVAGSLVASQAGEPADRSPVIIEDPRSPTSEGPRRDTGGPGDDADDAGREDRGVPGATRSPTPSSVPTSAATRTQAPVPAPADEADDESRDDESARVVTPKPTPVDDDDGPEDRDDDDTITDEDDDDAEDGGGDNSGPSDNSGPGSGGGSDD